MLVSRKKSSIRQYPKPPNLPMSNANRLPSTSGNPQVKILSSGPKFYCRDTWMIFWFYILDCYSYVNAFYVFIFYLTCACNFIKYFPFVLAQLKIESQIHPFRNNSLQNWLACFANVTKPFGHFVSLFRSFLFCFPKVVLRAPHLNFRLSYGAIFSVILFLLVLHEMPSLHECLFDWCDTGDFPIITV